MIDSSFLTCESSAGSGIFVDQSKVNMNNTEFYDLIADSGSAIFAVDESKLNISHSKFYDSSVNNDGIITLS